VQHFGLFRFHLAWLWASSFHLPLHPFSCRAQLVCRWLHIDSEEAKVCATHEMAMLDELSTPTLFPIMISCRCCFSFRFFKFHFMFVNVHQSVKSTLHNLYFSSIFFFKWISSGNESLPQFVVNREREEGELREILISQKQSTNFQSDVRFSTEFRSYYSPNLNAHFL
jgi:hypothetical protein